MRVPDVQFEADRYAGIFDKLTAPMDQERTIIGSIGEYSILGRSMYPWPITSLEMPLKKARLKMATRRYVRAIRANYPNEISPDATFISIRRNAGQYSGHGDNDSTNQEGTN